MSDAVLGLTALRSGEPGGDFAGEEGRDTLLDGRAEMRSTPADHCDM